mmetsp:Transcript_65646/g.182644  ORF Transcript_65646/g.182644 Transcript_65646/m.182644 type:complete len:380 (-) Transcript_65646:97-1236(-)
MRAAPGRPEWLRYPWRVPVSVLLLGGLLFAVALRREWSLPLASKVPVVAELRHPGLQYPSGIAIPRGFSELAATTMPSAPDALAEFVAPVAPDAPVAPVAPVSPQAPAMSKEKPEIYATFVDATEEGHRDKYILGFQALAESIHSSGATRPFVAVVSGAPSPALSSAAACMNVSLVELPPIESPWWGKKDRYRFKYTYSKLNVFRLEARRVVYLDVDTVVLRNIDELFSPGPALRAAPDLGYGCYPSDLQCSRKFLDSSIFNSGVMVITPSNSVFQDMMAQRAKLSSFDGGDQGFLNSYFQGSFHGAARLDTRFNTVQQQESRKDFDLARVSVIHYAGERKPWSTKPRHPYRKTQRIFQRFGEAFRRRCGTVERAGSPR